MRQNKGLERRSESIRAERALASRFSGESVRPATRTTDELRRAGLFTPAQQQAAIIGGVILLFGLLVLQKFGIPFSDDQVVQLCLPGAYLAILAIIILSRKIGIDYYRLLFFLVFSGLAVATNVLSGRPYSSLSLVYVMAIYFPFVFRFFISASVYRRLMNIYVLAAMGIVALVVIEHLIQLSFSSAAWPAIEKAVPTEFLVKDYNYIQPIQYGSRLMKPNAVFLLEASFVSQYIALGLIVELIFFGRMWRMLILTAGLLLSFGGTGLLLVIACLPFLVLRMSPRVMLVALVVLVFAGLAALEFGWYTQVSHRMTEYQLATSSAHERFVSPATALVDFLQRPDALYMGVGAGQIDIGHGEAWWPVTKVTVEYGVLTAAAFFAFFLYSLFGEGGHLRMGFALFLFYNFLSGSFAVPVNALTCVFFCTLFRVANPPKPPRRIRRPSPQARTSAAAKPAPEALEQSRQSPIEDPI